MLPLVFMGLVAAATASSNYTFPGGFNLSAISYSTRSSWCTAERNSCPEICGGVATSNSCDASTLDFSCVCSNGSTADVALYTQTIPFYVCQATYAQCIEASPTLDEQEECKAEETKNCGTLNASAVASGSSTTTSATSLTTATSTASSSSSDDKTTTATSTSSSSSSSSTANAAVRLAQEHATGLLATVMFLGLGLVL
ncbi:hypothetical protein BO70DRAFT_365862 [Aspergillus heteromorphus CBS 117.55]|uniref:DUF7707 domain-containing protein n=1 Tax=Aspergillus heteromorphus CBS 117.55 TaxID=1448321 RepID=A0A317V9B0_9EURO|nr:uncharacterized protein BO70DRAFT_365862 [Aspergillus heteromorphus CBS 117.55]PWY69587.1 hypothetical protein BO70DRAFT_365862 [Aspergillus heteromorphus CBS 117.55]